MTKIKKVKTNIKKSLHSKPIDLSVIIVSKDTKELTRQTIETALAAMRGIAGEIIVVDNGSADGSIEMLKKFGRKIHLLANKRNLGFGVANDRGAGEARGKILLFLNSDTIVPRDCLTKIVNFFANYPTVGIASPRLVNNDQEHTLQHGSYGKFSTPWRIILRFSRLMPGLKSGRDCTLVDWVSGAALAIRTGLFRQLNGFDENIFLYFEDEDLCRRARELDWDIAVIHRAEIIHLSGKSTNNKKIRTKFYDQSQNYFIAKHHGLVWSAMIQLLRLPYRLMSK